MSDFSQSVKHQGEILFQQVMRTAVAVVAVLESAMDAFVVRLRVARGAGRGKPMLSAMTVGAGQQLMFGRCIVQLLSLLLMA